MPGLIRDTEDHHAIRESVAKICTRYDQGYFLERSRAGEDVAELWSELGRAGLLGVHLPEEYGGGGGGMQDAVVVVEELAAHGLPMLVWVISPAMIGSVLAAHGSEELKSEWLPGIADGTKKVAFGLTEPDAGSNSHEVATTARKDGDGWVTRRLRFRHVPRHAVHRPVERRRRGQGVRQRGDDRVCGDGRDRRGQDRGRARSGPGLPARLSQQVREGGEP